MRRTRRLIGLLLAFFAIVFAWLLFANSGLRFMVARALPADGSAQVATVQGSVWSGIDAQGLRIDTPALRLSVREAHIDLALAPLWRGAVRIRSANLAGVTLEWPEPGAGATSAAKAAPVLPDVQIERLRVSALEIVQNEQRWAIDRVDARVSMHNQTVALDDLHLTAAMGRVDGDLALDLARDLPLQSARLAVDVTLDGQHVAGGLEARTERGRTGLTLALQSPLLAVVALSDVRDIDDWQARVEIPRQTWHDTPVAASLQLQTQQGALRMQGDASYDTLHLAAITAIARIEDDALQIASSSFDLSAPQGRVSLQGRIPFDATAPLTLEAATTALSFAADDAPPLRVAGAMALSGSRAALVLAPDLTLDRDGWPSATLDGRIVQQADAWLADDLHLVSGRSSLKLDGALTTATATPAALNLQLVQFDPALLSPDWPGAIDADLVWHGGFGAQGLNGELVIERLSGSLRERALQGAGTVVLLEGDLASARLNLSAGASSLQLTRASQQAPLDLLLDVPDLADLLPDGHGHVHATARIDRDWEFDVDAAEVMLPQFTLAQGRVHGRAGSDLAAPVTIQSTLRGFVLGGQSFERVQVAVDGTRAAHRVDLDVQAGARQLQVAAEGAWSPQGAWRGRMVGLDLLAPELRASLIEPAAMVWHTGQLSLARSCLAGEAGGRVCLQFAQDVARIDASAEVVALDLQPLTNLLAPKAPFRTEARLSGSADLTLVGGKLVALNARLDSAEGAMRVDERPDLDLGYRDLALDLKVDDGAGTWTASATLRPEGQVSSSGRLTRVDGEWQYEGDVHASVHRFDAIEAFTSQFASPRGDMSGDMQFRGRGLERPQWSGAFAVTGFAAELPDLGLQLSDGALAIAAVPTGIIVRGAITSGGGQLILDGGRAAEAHAPWHFALSGENAVLADTPALRLVLSPDLTLQQRERDWLLGGRVTIPEALIDAEVLAPPTDASSDVVIVDADDAEAADAARWNADVTLTFGEQAKLIGYGFDGRLRGDLRLRQRSGDNAYGQGQLQVSGRYAAYGQRLTIRRGRILFANSPLDEPTLDIEAERKAGSAVAGVRVTGTARLPQTEIYARPALPESEALALLVTGRNLRGVSGADRQRLSNAALALGTIGGDLLASNLGAEIGITGDAARGTEAFTIGKYLTPKLFIGYGIGLARRGSVLIVRYLIRDDVEFEATSGEQSRASLNYIIER